jgi:tRNA (cmo5U34)-methyltransferase
MDLSPPPWCFNAEVAAGFEDHAHQNIPGYAAVVSVSRQVAMATCQARDPIAEIGCATGYTLRALEDAGFENLLGVDSAPAMLDRCIVRHARLLCSSDFPASAGPFKLILINWTLHFVAPQQRFEYLRDVIGSLHQDGLLVLTEKTRQSPLTASLYEDFKRSRGMSEEAIAAKRASLIGVLEPLPHDWYASAFKALGLTYEILWAQLGFVSYLIQPVRHR